MILTVENNLSELPTTQSSFLSSAVVAGTNIIPVKNTNIFLANYAQQLGKTGEAQSEIVTIASIGTALVISGTLKYDHNLDTPIFQTHYDKVIFERSTTGTAGTATAITNGTISITPNSFYTEYDDTSGASTYAYKTKYYNSVNGDTSSETDWFTPAGLDYYSLQKMRQRAKDALYNANYLKSDDIIDDWINEWLELMTNAAIKVNQGYSIGTANIAFGTAGYGTVTSNDFKQPIKMEITWDGTNYVNSAETPYNRFSNTDVQSSMYPKHAWKGDTIFQILPFGNLGTARMTYSARNTPLVNNTDVLPMSLRSYTTSCVNYTLYRAYANDTKPELADQYYNKYLQGRNDFISEVTPRDQTGEKYINFVEGLSGMNEGLVIGSDWII